MTVHEQKKNFCFLKRLLEPHYVGFISKLETYLCLECLWETLLALANEFTIVPKFQICANEFIQGEGSIENIHNSGFVGGK